MPDTVKPLRLIVDSREQRSWTFPPHIATTRRAKIDAGDYCLDGDTGFAIERKSLDDFLGTVSTGWNRFERELDRMQGHVAKCIIVEGTLQQIVLSGPIPHHPTCKSGSSLKTNISSERSKSVKPYMSFNH